jgi:hypothetical protein
VPVPPDCGWLEPPLLPGTLPFDGELWGAGVVVDGAGGVVDGAGGVLLGAGVLLAGGAELGAGV